MSIIRVENLVKEFGQVKALAGISLQVEEGEVFGIVGPDGAGKTTCMRILSSIMNPTSGEAWVNGFSVVTESAQVKECIGYLSQKFGLYPDLTVQENLDFYADLFGVSVASRPAIYEKLLSFSSMQPFRKRLAGNLSGGMKQKLALACALVHAPTVLFMDEPTNGVDPVSRRDFWRIISKLRQEKITVFVTTAYLDEAERCNRIGLLHKGQLIASGSPEEIKKMLPGTLLELQTFDPRGAAECLKTRFTSENVTIFGDRLHFLCSTPAITSDLVCGALRERGFDVAHVRTVSPSLEDVFVATVERLERLEGSVHAK